MSTECLNLTHVRIQLSRLQAQRLCLNTVVMDHSGSYEELLAAMGHS